MRKLFFMLAAMSLPLLLFFSPINCSVEDGGAACGFTVTGGYFKF